MDDPTSDEYYAATAALDADEELVDSHWSAHIITLVKLFLALNSFRTTILAAQDWKNASTSMSKQVYRLLVFNAFLGVGYTAYKFTSKRIVPLYLIQTISHHGFLTCFLILTSWNDNAEIRKKSAGITKKMKQLHIIYAVLMIYGFLHGNCTAETPYPRVFVYGYASFCVTYIISRKFGLDEVKECLADEKDEEKKALCIAQFEAYFSKFKILLAWHGVELFLGKVLFKTLLQGALMCTDEGRLWRYRSNGGKLFLVLHLLGVTISLGTAGSIFVKTVKGKKAVAELKKDN